MQKVKYLINILLIFILLLSSSGVTIKKMTCLYSGDASYSLVDFPTCGDEEEAPVSAEIDSECCAFDSASLDLDAPSIIKEHTLDLKTLCLPVISSFLNIVVASPVEDYQHSFSGNSPPLIHENYLSFIQVFLI